MERLRSSEVLLIPSSWDRKTTRCGSLAESFYHAFNGLRLGFRQERNLKIQAFIAVCAITLAFLLKIDSSAWLALIFVIGLVLTVEFINTSIEYIVDLAANSTYHKSAKAAKDTAAAGVLIASGCAAFTGVAIFLPRLINIAFPNLR